MSDDFDVPLPDSFWLEAKLITPSQKPLIPSSDCTSKDALYPLNAIW
jgi:hypothetical protein